MFPTRSIDGEIIKSIDSGSVSSTNNILNFRKSLNQKPGIIDTPYREAYTTTPFSYEIEELMMAPQKPSRTINPQPYQMLAFCNELVLKVHYNHLIFISLDVY